MGQYKSIVITGASSGIGAAVAEEFAASGITLGLFARDSTRLEQVAVKCRGKGAVVITALIDLSKHEELGSRLEEIDDDCPIDLLIANAGITRFLKPGLLHEPEHDLERIIDTNYLGVIHTVLPVIDRMRKRNRGHVAVTSSLAAFHGIPAFPAYSASKAALLNYFQAIRGRLKLAGIDLTIICPGYIQTPMTDSLDVDKMMIMPVEKAARIIKRGIEKRKPLIAFPLLFRFGLWLAQLLPVWLSTWIFIKMFRLKK